MSLVESAVLFFLMEVRTRVGVKIKGMNFELYLHYR